MGSVAIGAVIGLAIAILVMAACEVFRDGI